MFDVLIKNAKIVSSQEIIEENLYIRDEKIAAVSRELLDEGAAKVIDAAGCIGFKAMMAGSVPDMFDVADDGSLLEIFRAIKEMDSTIGVHAENDALIHIEEQHLKAQGRKDITAYLDSRSEFQENEAVRRAIYLNSDPEFCLIIVHASNPGAVDIINQAKAEGHNVHCETGPHYLALCKEDGPKIGPYMKFAPPAREKARTDILWQQLAEGKIASAPITAAIPRKTRKRAGPISGRPATARWAWRPLCPSC